MANIIYIYIYILSLLPAGMVRTVLLLWSLSEIGQSGLSSCCRPLFVYWAYCASSRVFSTPQWSQLALKSEHLVAFRDTLFPPACADHQHTTKHLHSGTLVLNYVMFIFRSVLPRPPLRNINITQFKIKVPEWRCFIVCQWLTPYIVQLCIP